MLYADGELLQSFAAGQWASGSAPGVPVGTQQLDATTTRWLFVPPTNVVSADVRDGRVIQFANGGGVQGVSVQTQCSSSN